MMKIRKIMEIIKAYPLLFVFTVALPFLGGIIGAYVGWDSLKGRFDDNRNKAIVSEKIETHDSTLNKIVSKEFIIELGNNAIANGDREAYLKLIKIAEHFGKERNVAISQIARVKSHHYSMTSIHGIKLELYNEKNELIPEDAISTSQLMDNLLFNTQFLFRARSAQLLAYRNENFIHEVLLLSMFSDENLEVLRETTNAFGRLTGYKNPDFFMPYGCLGFWYNNAINVSERVKKVNTISIIPFQRFRDKIVRNMSSQESEEMGYWWWTSLELEQMLRDKHRIENKNRR